MRKERVEIFLVPEGKNSLHYWPEVVGFWKTVRNVIIISLGRIVPWFSFKNFLYSRIGVKVGKDVAFGYMAMLDIFFPELITIGENSIIGYNTTILAHEFLIKDWRKGPVVIGKDVMIGANCTILPGVVIGDGAVISAHSLVNRDVEAGAIVGGVPIKSLEVS